MKRHGFTLAEVLITLTIIGIVATLCLPALITDVNRQQNISKLGTIANTLSNTFGMMTTREDADNFAATVFGQSQDVADLQKYLPQVAADNGTFTMANGATFTLDDVIAGSNLNIDVNGSAGPNQAGEDQFIYTLNEDGSLEPTGDALVFARNNYKVTSVNNNNNGNVQQEGEEEGQQQEGEDE